MLTEKKIPSDVSKDVRESSKNVHEFLLEESICTVPANNRPRDTSVLKDNKETMHFSATSSSKAIIWKINWENPQISLPK